MRDVTESTSDKELILPEFQQYLLTRYVLLRVYQEQEYDGVYWYKFDFSALVSVFEVLLGMLLDLADWHTLNKEESDFNAF